MLQVDFGETQDKRRFEFTRYLAIRPRGIGIEEVGGRNGIAFLPSTAQHLLR